MEKLINANKAFLEERYNTAKVFYEQALELDENLKDDFILMRLAVSKYALNAYFEEFDTILKMLLTYLEKSDLGDKDVFLKRLNLICHEKFIEEYENISHLSIDQVINLSKVFINLFDLLTLLKSNHYSFLENEDKYIFENLLFMHSELLKIQKKYHVKLEIKDNSFATFIKTYKEKLNHL